MIYLSTVALQTAARNSPNIVYISFDNISRRSIRSVPCFRSRCEQRGPCPIPAVLNERLHQSNKRQMIWLLCFSCKQRNREPREDNTDDYEHHPVGDYKGVNEVLQNGAGKDKETREKMALSYLEEKLVNFINPISNRMNTEDAKRLNAEEMLNITEEGIKELTPIVDDEEIFTFNITNVGRIQMSKGVHDFNDNVHLLANKSTVIAVVEFQPDVSVALMPSGGHLSMSGIVSVTMFDDSRSSNKGHTKLRENVSITFGHGSQIVSQEWTTFPPSAFSAKCVYWNFTTSNWSTDGCLARWVSMV